MSIATYDPFATGRHAVVSRTLGLVDHARGRTLPCELWRPDGLAGPLPLVVYSHLSGAGRLAAVGLCAHLASHGYLVAAPDHSEVVAPELAPAPDETAEARAARVDATVGARVPDVRLVLDRLLRGGADLDAARIGLVGHSFGGWTVLAAPDVEPRVRAVVAMAPGGSSRPRPGILPVQLRFAWGRPVPLLILAGDADVMTPLDGIAELYGRAPDPKRLLVLRGADHLHFADDVATAHEQLRRTTLPGEAAWIPAAMRPIAELCPPEQAAAFVRGLTLAHLDAALRGSRHAAALLADPEAALAARGIDGAALR
jgi:predicted dienelactone hydrolase